MSAGPAGAAEPLRLFTLTYKGDDRRLPHDGAPAAAVNAYWGALAPMPDGSVLVAAEGAVWRLHPTGRLSRAAGREPGRRRATFNHNGDGGAARNAILFEPTDIALTPDGGFLIADRGACNVRKVASDGRITTVAGQPFHFRRGESCTDPVLRDCGSLGDGGPATAARLYTPTGIAVTPDGGFLVADTHDRRVRRVAPDGTISTAAGSRPPPFGCPPGPVTPQLEPSDVAATPDGGFLMADLNGVHRVSANGTITSLLSARDAGFAEDGTIFYTKPNPGRLRVLGSGPFDLTIGGGRPGFFGGDGDPIRTADPFDVPNGEVARDVERTRYGVLIATPSRLLLAARRGSSRLAIAVARESLPALLHHRLRLRSTRSARVRVDLLQVLPCRRIPPPYTCQGPRRVRMLVRARAGLNTFRLPPALRPGSYLVRVRATTAAGTVATDSLPVLVGAKLPRKVARAALVADFPWDDESTNVWARPCRRFGPRRVDCVVGFEETDLTGNDCKYLGTATLRSNGYLYVGSYRCRKRRFMERPRLRTFHQAYPLIQPLKR
jgi:NHL repeat